MAKPINHGTVTGYYSRGCRCDECRAAGNAYMREKRRAVGPPMRACTTCQAILKHSAADEPQCRQCRTKDRQPRKLAAPRMVKPPTDLRSPMRKAYEAGDDAALLATIKEHTVQSPQGCWEWQRRLDKNGYAHTRIAGKYLYVHRLAAQAAWGLLPSEPVVHHTCANRRCVNPDHLQPISHRENVAEMMQRNFYLQRIVQLEAALAAASPSHWLIAQRA